MEAKRVPTRPSPTRVALAEGQARSTQQPPMLKTVDILTGSSPRMPHHESLRPEGNLSMRGKPSAMTTVQNKRVSAVTNTDRTESNRNSGVSQASAKSRRKTHVGPWQLGRTLGKGATGRVRLAKHALTGQPAAIKIVSKKSAALVQSASMAQMDQETPQSTSAAGFRMMPFGIEREIVIMKLVEHPNVINLFDVWENRGEL